MKFHMIGINDDGSEFEEGPIALEGASWTEATEEAKAIWDRDGGWYRYHVRRIEE